MRALPLSIVCVSKERSSAVAVWAAVSELVQRTRPPFFTVTVTGWYLNDLMSTVAVLTVLDCGDITDPEPPEALEPHPAASAPAATSRAVAAVARISPLLRRPSPGGSPSRR